MSEKTTNASRLFTILEGTWKGKGRGGYRRIAGLKPIAQYVEALRADDPVGFPPTSTN